MYENFYGLKEKPFQIVPNPKYLYMSSVHENAITYLEYGLMENVGFILLTGEVGAGKTTLVRHIMEQFESKKDIAVIFNTNVSVNELVYLILQSFGLNPLSANKSKNIETFYQFLIDKYSKNKQVLLVIDEAQNLSDKALEEVRMLSNLQSDDQNLIQIMMVGQPELKDRLQNPDHSPFAQRIAVNFFLSGLNEKETKSYITYRLKKAGGNPNIFSPESIHIIYQTSRGIPRTINLLCDTALVYGFGYELDTIDASVIEQVIKDKGGMGINAEVENKEGFSQKSMKQDVGKSDRMRLKRLEDTVKMLQRQADFNKKELEQKLEGFEKKSFSDLKNLLLEERRRNEKLMISYSQLKVKYDDLRKDRKGDLSDQQWIESLIQSKLEKLSKK